MQDNGRHRPQKVDVNIVSSPKEEEIRRACFDDRGVVCFRIVGTLGSIFEVDVVINPLSWEDSPDKKISFSGRVKGVTCVTVTPYVQSKGRLETVEWFKTTLDLESGTGAMQLF